MSVSYSEFLGRRSQLGGRHGFEVNFMPDSVFGFQQDLIEFAVNRGRAAIFADCGLGKSLMQLVWAENVVRHTNKPVLILTPLAVSHQMVREAEKFGIDCRRSGDGSIPSGGKIVVTNYERLHLFDCSQFAGVVCDESSILKNFEGVTKQMVTEFMRLIPYRLLCTATAAPNDFIELGTSAEALGEMGYIDMLQTFFKANDGSYAQGGSGNGAKRFSKDPYGGKFRFRGHAERDFWRWVCSWARACRKPSDLGYSEDGFKLPKLAVNEHIVHSSTWSDDFLFPMVAVGLAEQRQERSRTTQERCQMAAEIVCSHHESNVSWCHTNAEAETLLKMIGDDAVEVSGKDSDERKEECFRAFEDGEVRVMITKSRIGGFGLNWQHCHRQTFFPSHSFEQYYQSVRRSWRFGQRHPVTVDIIASDGEADVLKNLNRKAEAAERMFAQLISLMRDELSIQKKDQHTKKQEIPAWL